MSVRKLFRVKVSRYAKISCVLLAFVAAVNLLISWGTHTYQTRSYFWGFVDGCIVLFAAVSIYYLLHLEYRRSLKSETAETFGLVDLDED